MRGSSNICIKCNLFLCALRKARFFKGARTRLGRRPSFVWRSHDENDGHAPHTLQELDYLLGVSDVSRLGALRFRKAGEEAFRSPAARGVPKPVDLGRLLGITERILREEETDEDLQMILRTRVISRGSKAESVGR